jgi:hypothetical protein
MPCFAFLSRDNALSFIKPTYWKISIEITNMFALLEKHCCLFIYKLKENVFPVTELGTTELVHT